MPLTSSSFRPRRRLLSAAIQHQCWAHPDRRTSPAPSNATRNCAPPCSIQRKDQRPRLIAIATVANTDKPAVCDSTTSPLGFLSIRRTYTNNTGQPVTRLRFRVVDITTTPEGTGSSGNSIADLRALSRSGSFPVTPLVGSAVTVQGLMLEQPPNQAVGGGFNASLAAPTVTLQSPLAATDNPATTNVRENAITVEFLLGIVQGGNFRFFVNVEALP